MGYAQDLVNQGYYGYAGWPDEAARQDFQATGGAGKGGPTGGGGTSGGGNSTDSILNNAIQAIISPLKVMQKYDEANPFFFDEELARRASEAQYAPYYDETLSDYVARIERDKSRSQEDLNRTLDYLSASKEHFLGAERRALDKAERQTNEGYAGAGLFFSGVRQRDLRELKEGSEARIGEYETGYQYGTSGAGLTAKRFGETVATEETQTRRDLGREKKFAVEIGVVQRKGEVRDEHEISRKKYYDDYLSGIV